VVTTTCSCSTSSTPTTTNKCAGNDKYDAGSYCCTQYTTCRSTTCSGLTIDSFECAGGASVCKCSSLSSNVQLGAGEAAPTLDTLTPEVTKYLESYLAVAWAGRPYVMEELKSKCLGGGQLLHTAYRLCKTCY
jgi:hypothetical protein